MLELEVIHQTGPGLNAKKQVTNFKAPFWYTFIQAFWFWATELRPSTRERRRKADVEFLKLVQAYKPKIIAQYESFELYYRCCQYQLAQKDLAAKETWELQDEARGKVNQLTMELQRKLSGQGWPYRKLFSHGRLVHIWRSQLDMGRVWEYWDAVEQFLIARSSR